MVESYSYTDADGRKLFQVRRYEPKGFRQFRWNGTRWVAGLKGVAPVLYRLPEVLTAVAAGETIYVPEGERDVHTLETLGLVATTNPAGAGKWRPEFNEFLRGARVCIVMDWDPPAKKATGQAHALKVYESLLGVAARVELFRPAKGCKDVTDHVDAGKSLDDLIPMTEEKLRWYVAAHGTPAQPAAAVPSGAERAAGVPLVLATVVGLLAGRGQVVRPRDPGGDWQVCCPVHEDRNPSATLRAGTDRPVIFKCHAGCEPAEFLAWCQRQGVPLGDLMDWKGTDSGDGSTWEPVDFVAVLHGETEGQQPSLLIREDGAAMFYAGRVHAVNSEPEAGKTWLALFAAVQVMQSGGRVLYVDFEDSAPGIADRLKSFNLPAGMVEALFAYIRPDEPLTPAAEATVLKLLDETNPLLVIVDGVTEAMSLHGLSIMGNDDAAQFMKLLPRLLTRTGAAVVQLDHVTKSTENRKRWAIGAQHKLAGIDGASFGLEIVQPFGRGMTGRSTLTIGKDRPGFVRPQAMGGRAGQFTLESTESGMVTARFATAPNYEVGGVADVPPEMYAEICAFLEGADAPSSKQVKDAVTGRSVTVDLALESLRISGHVTFEKVGNAKRWTLLKPWEEQ